MTTDLSINRIEWRISFYEQPIYSTSRPIVDVTNMPYLPRKDEKVIINHIEYRVTEVQYSLDTADVSITVFSLGSV